MLRSWRERRPALSACGLGWVLIAKAALRVPGAPLPRKLSWVDWLAARLPPPSCTAAEAARAVTAAARRAPGTRCLEWTLALRGLLAQARIASDVRIGVAPAGPGAIKAHAWVESDGATWSWGDVQGYSVLWPRSRAAP
jgi:hypothetical protein